MICRISKLELIALYKYYPIYAMNQAFKIMIKHCNGVGKQYTFQMVSLIP